MPNTLHMNIQSEVSPNDKAGIQRLLQKAGPGARVVHDPSLAVNSVLLETHEYVPVEEPLVCRSIADVTGEDEAPLVADGALQENKAKDDAPLAMPTMDFGSVNNAKVGSVNNAKDDLPLIMPSMF